jgi:chorismate synthase
VASLDLITAGESHGPGLTCLVQGLPAGLELDRDAIDRDMARRQLGFGRGGRMKIETDRAHVTAGVRHGRTLGGPIALQVANRDYANWEERMNPWPVEAEVAEVHLPRPGHADLVGTQKYGLTDVRDVLERASARETAGPRGRRRAGQGVPARARRRGRLPRRPDRDGPGGPADRAPRRSTTSRGGRRPRPLPGSRGLPGDGPAHQRPAEGQRVDRRDFEVLAFGLVPGLGSHVSWEERLDGRLAMAIVSIQAIKGVEFGDGFGLAATPGSQAHDEIFFDDERGFHRRTNHAGGLEGGMTTGDPLIGRAVMKPIPTLTKPLRSVDIDTHEPTQALRERTDSCTVPAGGVVGEAMVAFVLADAYRRKFGGDHIDDVREAVERYEERIGWKRARAGA